MGEGKNKDKDAHPTSPAENEFLIFYYLLHNYFRAKSSVGEEHVYRSKKLIEEKIKQLKFVYSRRIKRHEGKLFKYGGKDNETGCYHLDVDFGNFITIGRNIFQYAYKEAKPNTEFKRRYESYIEDGALLKFFKELRDSEIHIEPGGHQTTVKLESRFIRDGENNDEALAEEKKIKSKPPEITYEISKILEPTAELYSQYKEEGKTEIVEAIENGTPLYIKTEFEGETDLFKLCEKYIDEIELFLKYGVEQGFIT